jgi:putative flippase GtrA
VTATSAPPRTLLGALHHPAVRYLLVGGGTFLADLLLLMLLHGALHLPLPLATGISFTIATGGNFLLNRAFTFSADGVAGPALRYAILVGLNFVVSVVLVPLLTYGISLDYRLSKVVISVAAVFWNYVAYRLWVFA